MLEPGSQASLSEGKFHVEPRPATDRLPYTIDHFLRSLAADQRSNSIAIILSETDSDGALGIRAIKNEEGIAIVQDPSSAKFPGRPQSGILADNIDLVLPVAQIGTELARIANRFRSPAFASPDILRPAREGRAPAIRDGILRSSAGGLPVRIAHIRSDSSDFSRGVVESVQIPIVVLGADFKIYTANNAFRTLVRLDPDDLDRRSFSELVNLVWRLKNFETKLASLRAGSLVDSFEFEHRFAEDEIECLLRINVRAVRGIGTDSFVITLEVITGQRRTEAIFQRERGQLAAEVRKTSTALIRTQEDPRALTARLFTSQEAERQRVAMDLHDDVGQQLASVQIELERVLSESADQTTRNSVGDIRERIEKTGHIVRRISNQLHPSILANLGLAVALRQLVASFGEQERSLSTFVGLNVPEVLLLYFASAYYRIAQEALRSVAKHAGPTHVRVSLQCTDNILSMTLRDLGDGFDTDGQPQTGIGLLSTKERARHIGETANRIDAGPRRHGSSCCAGSRRARLRSGNE